MTYLEKINQLAEGLNTLGDKLDSVDEELLVDKSDKQELIKIKELLNFYRNTIVELVIDQNKLFIKENKDFTRDIIKEIEYFILTVNESLTI